MSLLINAFQPLGTDMSVDLRGTQILMPEHLLHTAQIRSGIEQMRGKAVAQFVRRKIRRQSSLKQI